MARNNFEVNGKKYCLLMHNVEHWEITDVFGNTPPEDDAKHPDFHKTAMAVFEDLKSAGYKLFVYIDPRMKK